MKMNREILHDAVICKENDSVLEVSRIMRDTKTRHIIVVSKKMEPLGIISPFDINNRVVAEGKDAKSVSAKDIMTKPIETIELSATFEQAAEKMGALETFTLPVVENKKLIGILNYSVVYRSVCKVEKNDNQK
jgi:CBS domain-containing protein